MNATLIAFMSIGLYGLGTAYEALSRLKASREQNSLPLVCGMVAVILQVSVLALISSQPSVDPFSSVNSAAMISGMVVALFIALSLKYPTQSMLFIIYPTAIASLTLLVISDPASGEASFNLGILTHITLSILAYSILTLAAIDAILVVLRGKQLKQHQNKSWLDRLPPLLTMESILFDLIRMGTLSLAAAILLGFLFVDNLFAQHLVHKTFFSIVALIVYTTLLVGRLRYGWRGSLAASLTLWGTGSLMLGFFGTKIVLEAIL